MFIDRSETLTMVVEPRMELPLLGVEDTIGEITCPNALLRVRCVLLALIVEAEAGLFLLAGKASPEEDDAESCNGGGMCFSLP